MAALASPVTPVTATPTKHRHKKRPTSPANSGGATAKKKKIGQNIVLDTIGENKSLAADSSPGHGDPAVKPLVFKDPNFIIPALMLFLPLNRPKNTLTFQDFLFIGLYGDCNSIHKISGHLANYTDPQSKLRYSSTEEFSYIRMLPSDIVTGYLALRKATSIVP
ncbi:INO80 complex subunit C isoform X3 [Scyliorhinus canicula]|uniref:INO80 complex subunit C isoform X3 n=1 Tax=Scyliorhinus canicula TaxID=7830 RepID=UPI0018F40B34|nr:INO80 complex subunit C isoform X3 [Scyliorhinus canicula]